jgi:hypothetical protein
MELVEQIHDLGAVAGIEIAGGLVGQQHQRAASGGPRHRHPLLLPAGELGGIMPEPVEQADPLQRLMHRGPALVGLHPPVLERQLHVLVHREVADQVEGLEDEADRPAPHPGPLRLREGRDRLTREDVAPLARRVEQPQDREQRRLAAAGGPADPDVLARPDLQVHRREGVGLHLLRVEDLGNPGQADQRVDRERHGAYSFLSATIGSAPAARRAGR